MSLVDWEWTMDLGDNGKKLELEFLRIIREIQDLKEEFREVFGEYLLKENPPKMECTLKLYQERMGSLLQKLSEEILSAKYPS